MSKIIAEIRQREAHEHETQLLSQGYQSMLRGMWNDIDDWLDAGGSEPVPVDFKRFPRHNWYVRSLPRNQRIRISKLRLRLDQTLNEETVRQHAVFREAVERAEINTRNSSPFCCVCRFGQRNKEITVNKLICGHMFHTRCVTRHLKDNINPMFPNCNAPVANSGERVHFS